MHAGRAICRRRYDLLDAVIGPASVKGSRRVPPTRATHSDVQLPEHMPSGANISSGAEAWSDLLPLSALQHLLFCERQCALIHVERIWVENPLTLEGRHLHERVDQGQGESRGSLHVARGVALRSLRLGISGKADLVE